MILKTNSLKAMSPNLEMFLYFRNLECELEIYVAREQDVGV